MRDNLIALAVAFGVALLVRAFLEATAPPDGPAYPVNVSPVPAGDPEPPLRLP